MAIYKVRFTVLIQAGKFLCPSSKVGKYIFHKYIFVIYINGVFFEFKLEIKSEWDGHFDVEFH